MLKNSSADFVVIALGGNDMLRGLSPHQTKRNLKEMITLARKQNRKIAVLGIEAPAHLGENYVKNFNQIFRELEREERVAVLKNYIQSVAGKFEYNLSDGIHPNSEGQKKLAEVIFEFLNPLIKQEKRERAR
jgi:acyl-CoA thioesterase-1